MGGPNIKWSEVVEIKKLHRENPNLNYESIGAIVGRDRSTVGRVIAGKMDHLEDEKADELPFGGGSDLARLADAVEMLARAIDAATDSKEETCQSIA